MEGLGVSDNFGSTKNLSVTKHVNAQPSAPDPPPYNRRSSKRLTAKCTAEDNTGFA